MNEMNIWDIGAYWSTSRLLSEQFEHFRKEFLHCYHLGLFGWTFA